MTITKGGDIKKMNMLSIILISCLFALIIGFIFMIVYFVGETFGFAPDITLGNMKWFTSGEGVILYTTMLLLSIFIGSIIILCLLRRYS